MTNFEYYTEIFEDFVPENNRVIMEAKRMMHFLEKTLKLGPRQKPFVSPKLQNMPKLPRFDMGGLKVNTDTHSDNQDNIRQMTRLRVANALRRRMEKNQNILTSNKKDQIRS